MKLCFILYFLNNWNLFYCVLFKGFSVLDLKNLSESEALGRSPSQFYLIGEEAQFQKSQSVHRSIIMLQNSYPKFGF